MRKFLMMTLMTATLAAPAYASGSEGGMSPWADLTTETTLGRSMADVKATLTEMGFDTRKAEMEDGMIEAYVVRDGKMAEIYVDAATGKVARVKAK